MTTAAISTTFGIEEEFLLLDAETGLPASSAPTVVASTAHLERPGEYEFLSCQLEISTPVCTSAQQAEDILREGRYHLRDAASDYGIIIAPTGLPPMVGDTPAEITAQPRYQEISQHIRRLGHARYSTSTHVHIGLSDPQAGIRVIAGLARWMPALLALTANSPLWKGSDTGFSSWRFIRDLTWPVSGYPPAVDTSETYQRIVDTLIESQVILDPGMINWSVRLSHRFPTIEVRLADAQLTPEDSVAFALILRALTHRILRQDETSPTDATRSQALINGALWHAAREGLSGNLVDPGAGVSHPASHVLTQLENYISAELAELGDTDRVTHYLKRRLSQGSPAATQRAHFESAGFAGLHRFYSHLS